ncbi:molybdenum cofactor synthesis 2 [Neolentinus lepideus HHB14362 ss-1]|uniref:Molybdenum cofactor synthesis 2 n=1 Tax=Neolentinus lepideus HHB14362 ss-1 TaxID=1314782 RepID=A0A165W334_9AGAM|nr:molybdenum cofactor synthesis 2 [Neolentinus lepideus HHB14362 ss-1]
MSSASVDARDETELGVAVLTHGPLNVEHIVASVADDGAGATAVFIGTTRNSFKGKVVTKLEYQAYSKLAIKTIADIIADAHASFTPLTPHTHAQSSQRLIRIAVHHRLGTVPVGEPSIVIAVSSPHRKESFVACEMVLEEVKKKVQIWKREYYEGEREDDAEWKANA